MKVFDDGTTQLYHADSRALPIPDESVDMIMTSPPYYSARKYGEGAGMVWDGAEGCEHVWGEKMTVRHRGQAHGATAQVGNTLADVQEPVQSKGQFCQLCGAWRGQLGLEPSLDLYIAHLMQIADECWRVLKGGVMVWNLGDSYATHASKRSGQFGKPIKEGFDDVFTRAKPKLVGLKELDLCMVPSRCALALQERGWYLRSAIPWLKKASMPESQQGDRWERCRVKVGTTEAHFRGKAYANQTPQQDNSRAPSESANQAIGKYTDCPGCPKCAPNDGLVLRHGNWRPGKSLEWLLVLSKTGSYYSDSEGVRLPNTASTLERAGYGWHGVEIGGLRSEPDATEKMGERWAPSAGRNRREADWFYDSLDDIIAHHEREARRLKHLRDNGGLVWEGEEPLALLLNPKGFKAAHFATFPVALCTPFIKAYTSDKGNCPECGKPWVRVVETKYVAAGGRGKEKTLTALASDGMQAPGPQGFRHGRANRQSDTLGWRPTCDHGLDPIPATVLDPFAGACSTAIAAGSLGRKSIMIECCEEYLDMAIKRLGGGYTVEAKGGVEVKQTQMFGEDTPGEEE